MVKFFLSTVIIAATFTVNAQRIDSVSAKEYEKAAGYLAYNTESLIYRNSVRPFWLAGDKFWYSVITEKGMEFILVDPGKKTRTAAFDQQQLAIALSKASGRAYEPYKLPFPYFRFSPDDKFITFSIGTERWKYDLKANKVAIDTAPALPDPTVLVPPGRRGESGNAVLSPDGKLSAFIKDYNLWVREVATKDTAYNGWCKRFRLCY